MNLFFLAMIRGQLFGFEKHAIAGIGVRDASRVQSMKKQGQRYIPLPNEKQALVCDLFKVLDPHGTDDFKQSHYLILTFQDQFLALSMTGKGRLLSMDVNGQLSLPHAFTGFARDLVAGAIPNGKDIILLLHMAALFKVPHHMAA
ncbi:hypothetical protein [Desulfobulbus alkaliphilus]|uniref:hypothetical protein n=1 Tax=Desulfobulbus alkaliphilus TaxID=869814 RepID=UPI0019633F54|nr:hypothetical protein [Desulfobulbus alkaliphilus]MBM9536453.1 hypothetical protein [Desulfobulbus alkaliphilus]